LTLGQLPSGPKHDRGAARAGDAGTVADREHGAQLRAAESGEDATLRAGQAQ
jgi:hypothetical protein